MLLYDELLAEKLQTQFQLADATIRVWKHRNRIPAKYLTEGAMVTPEKASKAQEQRILDWLQRPYTNRCGFDGVAAHRMNDLLRGGNHVRLRKEEANDIIRQIKALQKKALKIAENQDLTALLAFIKEPMLKPLVWLDNYKLYNRLRQGLKSLPEADWAVIKPLLALLGA